MGLPPLLLAHQVLQNPLHPLPAAPVFGLLVGQACPQRIFFSPSILSSKIAALLAFCLIKLTVWANVPPNPAVLGAALEIARYIRDQLFVGLQIATFASPEFCNQAIQEEGEVSAAGGVYRTHIADGRTHTNTEQRRAVLASQAKKQNTAPYVSAEHGAGSSGKTALPRVG